MLSLHLSNPKFYFKWQRIYEEFSRLGILFVSKWSQNLIIKFNFWYILFSIWEKVLFTIFFFLRLKKQSNFNFYFNDSKWRLKNKVFFVAISYGYKRLIWIQSNLIKIVSLFDCLIWFLFERLNHIWTFVKLEDFFQSKNIERDAL